MAVAALFVGSGSVVLDDTFAVLVITVPEGVVGFTFTTTLNVVEAPAANVGIVEEIEPPRVRPARRARNRRHGY